MRRPAAARPFSPWLGLPADHRAVVLDALEDLACDQFGGVVERPYFTPVYLARRRADDVEHPV